MPHSSEPPPTLAYQPPVPSDGSARNVIAWVTSVALGAAGGVVLANSDVGAFCAATGAGAIVPFAAGAIAERRRFIIGLTGNLTTVLVCLCWVFARTAAGAPINVLDALKSAAVISMFVVIPGLVAGAFVALIESTTSTDE